MLRSTTLRIARISQTSPPISSGSAVRRVGGCSSATTIRLKSSSAGDGAKKLHKGIEEGLLKSPQRPDAGSASSSSAKPYAGAAAPPVVDPLQAERKRRTRQALVNVTCSFMVLLLAAQSYKSGADKRRTAQRLEEQSKVLAATQERLRAVTVDAPAAMAAACAAQVLQEQQQQQQSTSRWWWSSLLGANHQTTTHTTKEQERQELEAKFLAILKVHLEKTVGEAALTQEERDQKRALEAAMSDDTLMEVAVALEEEEGAILEENKETGETVVKRRLYSI